LSKRQEKKSISILQITDSFLPHVGGKQLVVHHLASDLTLLDCSCSVLTNGSKDDNLNKNLPYTVFYYIKVFKILKFFFNLASIVYHVIKENINLIHAHRTFPAGYHAFLIGKLFNIPIIITAHGDDILTVPKINYGINLKKRLMKKSLYALQNADAIIALNEGMKSECIKLGTSPSKIYCIPIGININSLNDNRKLSSKKNRGKNLIVVGRNHPVKGYENLIKAISIVVKNDSEIKCTIIGKNTFKLFGLVEALCLQNNITLVNQIDKSIEKGMPIKLQNLYKNSDIYISSSLSESFSLTILEAMAMGLPVIATDTVGSRGLIDDKINGFIIPVDNPEIMAEKILFLTNDYSLQKRLGERARSKAKMKQYSWNDIALKHLSVYKQLMLINGIFI